MKKIIYFIIVLTIFATSCTTQEEKKSDMEALIKVEFPLYEKISDTTKIPIVVVTKGMTLWDLSENISGDPEKWGQIAGANYNIITDDDYRFDIKNERWSVILHPGDTLVIPEYLLKKPLPKEVVFLEKVEEHYTPYWGTLYTPILNEVRGDSILVAHPYHPNSTKDNEMKSDEATWNWVRILLSIVVAIILLFLMVAGFTFLSLFWGFRGKKGEDDDEEGGEQEQIDIQKLNVEMLMRYLQHTGGELYIEKNKNGDVSIMISILEQKPSSK